MQGGEDLRWNRGEDKIGREADCGEEEEVPHAC